MIGKDDKKRRMEDQEGPIITIVAAKTQFNGVMDAQESVRICGRFEGEVKCSEMVRIDKNGKLIGPLESKFVIIEGEMNGDIKSAEHVELRSDCRMTGNITTQKIAIAEGCIFKGEIQMPSKTDRPIRFEEKRGRIEIPEKPE